MKVLPLYLPFEGCAHQCVFCNQPLTVGRRVDRPQWEGRLEHLKHDPDSRWEIAFYGGTFSALPQADMDRCFAAVPTPCQQQNLSGFRISTRPDAVSNETLHYLQQNGVHTIELGVESLDDAVLQKSGRGHTAQAVIEAAKRIQEHGFQLGFHLMCGLPGQSRASWEQTVHQSIKLRPDMVRIAPTLVLKETPLERLYQRGRYQPMPLDEAIEQCAFAYQHCHREGISIARVGLALSDDNGHGEDKLVAGPWHPALRHEVESYLIRKTVEKTLRSANQNQVYIHPKDQSIVFGHKKNNLAAWQERLKRDIAISLDSSIPRHSFHSGDRILKPMFYDDE